MDDDVFTHPQNVMKENKEIDDKDNKDKVNDKDDDDSRHRSWNSTDRESQSDNEQSEL